jgi:NAD(P)-dependent dehydrogenase (short-subunit alcohol dehydrogenase family)
MNKPYLIVGGTSGVSLRLAEILLQRGESVIALSRTRHDLYNGNPNATHVPGDVLADELPSIPTEKIAGLVYAPGSINLKPLRSLSIQDFIDDYRINLLGAVKVIQHVTPLLCSEPPASIVLFSTVAVRQGMPFHASIASAKGAVEGLVRSLAAELAPRVRVNAIAPSLTDTPLAGKLLNSDAKQDSAKKRHPLQRFGTSDDIAHAADFLLSPQSGWITGQILGVDGGLSSLRTN